MTLDEYLADAARRRWCWGYMDCCHFAGGWIRAKTGKDPMADFSYSTDGEAVRILQARGGLLTLLSATMEKHGFQRTNTPEDGDIAFVSKASSGPMDIAGGSVVIRSGPWWIAKGLRGIVSVSAGEVPAWRIC